MKIKYVGLKQFEDAFKGETGVTWGPGVEHDIDAAIAARMLKHPDVFALSASVKEPETPKQPEAPALVAEAQEPQEEAQQTDDTGNVPGVEDAPKAEHIMRTDSGKPLVLDTLDLATLRELAKEQGIKVGNSGAERIRERLAEAFPMVG